MNNNSKKATELISMPSIGVILPDNQLPQPDDINSWILFNERKIYVDYEIDDNVMMTQRCIMRWNQEDKNIPVEDRKPIYLYIMSGGGDLDYAWTLIDTIEASVTPVYTVNIGVAASAASLIFMAGTKRYMMKKAHVLIHEGSASLNGDAIKVIDASDSYKKILKQMKEYILSKTNIPQRELSKKRANDWELDINMCKEYNVCTDVIESLNDIL